MFTKDTIDNESKCFHIPYILNGELYEIQTQDGENVTVKCCNCPPDRVYRGSVRSTGNFHMHIKRRHPDLLGRLHEMKVVALTQRRERLVKAKKKLRNNNNIKKEQELCCDERQSSVDRSNSMVIDEGLTMEPINYSLKGEFQQIENGTALLSADVEAAQPFVTTEIHCDLSSEIATGNFLLSNHHHSLGSNNINAITIVKNEVIPVSNEQAIDLSASMQSPSQDAFESYNTSSELENTNNLEPKSLMWNEALQHVEQSLRDIQREMSTRNRIETSRLFLDLAKFKFLNPGFNF